MSHAAKMEIVTRAERRRWSSEEKLRIVRETLDGASVGVVSRRHGVASNLLYTWRRRALAGALAGFAPVEVADRAFLPASGSARLNPAAADSSAKTVDDLPRGGIEVVLTNGYRVRVGRGADIETLRGVFATLGVR